MSKTNWSLFVPIYNLELTKDIGKEIRIGQVTFIAAEKIPRVKRRLCLPDDYKTRATRLISEKPFPQKTYAFLKTKRTSEEPLNREFELIKEAVYLLASSQFYRINRNGKILFGSAEYNSILFDEYAIYEHGGRRYSRNDMRLTFGPYRLDERWKRFTADHFFPRLLKIVNGNIPVDTTWKNTLKRAALLAGQSHFSKNQWEAFLYNMIALEALLTKRGDKFPDALIERVVTFFGWVTEDKTEHWEKMIERLYYLRCQFAHDGKTDDLEISDLVNADMLLFNLLYNLCWLTKEIKSKKDILNLTNKLAARRVLGMKEIDRPKRLSFSEKVLSESDYKKLETARYWAW